MFSWLFGKKRNKKKKTSKKSFSKYYLAYKYSPFGNLNEPPKGNKEQKKWLKRRKLTRKFYNSK